MALARAAPGAANTTSANTAATALNLSNIDFHIARSAGDAARSAWMRAVHAGPSSFAMAQSCAIRSSGIGFRACRQFETTARVTPMR